MTAKAGSDKFWAKVQRGSDADCWPWLAAKTHAGYGRYKAGGIALVAHRASYEMAIGPIPKGLQLDHLCRNTSCVNPKHLEPVTAKENQRRGTSPISLKANQTHCIRGHELSGENLHIRTNGHRMCWTCHHERQRVIRSSPNQKAKHAARERAYRKEKAMKNAARKAVRQGDVLVIPVDQMPPKVASVAPEGERLGLAYGESTGHSHSLRFSDCVALFREDGSGGGLFLSVTGGTPAALDHQEHSTLPITPGAYRVLIQRTYVAGMVRRVAD